MKKRNWSPERLKRYEKLVRRMRQRIFDYPENLEKKASRVLSKALAITGPMYRYYQCKPTDQWGATWEDRNMLGRQGIAWGD